jgi:hypothetical protein
MPNTIGESDYLSLGFSIGIQKYSSSSRSLAYTEESDDTLANNEVNSIKEEQSAKKLEEARLALDKAKNNYCPENYKSSSEDFRQLANGVFQAEGCVSAWFNGGSLLVSPIVNLGQTYTSPEVFAFFVRLYHELGGIGRLYVSYNVSNKLFITWSITNWDLILNRVSNYFDSLYGEKYQGFNKLKVIYKLKSVASLNNPENQAELVRLVYSFNVSGKSRKLSIEDKLKSLNLEGHSLELKTKFNDNPRIPTFLFLLGFFLGDGGIYIRIRVSSSGGLNFIPSLILFQKPSNMAAYMFERMSKSISSLGINSLIIEGGDRLRTTNIRIEGINAISLLVPLLEKNSSLIYWKGVDINKVLKFLKYHSAGFCTYPKGLVAVLNLLYQDPNSRSKTLDEWIKLAENHFIYLNAKYKSGHQFISTVSKLKKPAGCAVIFSNKLVTLDGKNLKGKSFLFTTYGSEARALKSALEYRDSILESHFKEWEEYLRNQIRVNLG